MSDEAQDTVSAWHATQEDVERLARFVVDTVQPLRVILFGSTARGDRGPDSDVDLLVVMPDGVDRREVFRRLTLARRRHEERFRFPIDFVVMTESAYEQKRNVVGRVQHDASREGRTLYAA